jgi:hypothetical protein
MCICRYNVEEGIGEVLLLSTKKCDRIDDVIRLNNDYFIERPLFNSKEFRRRYNVNANSILLL